MLLKRCSFDPKMQLCAFSYIACHMTCLPAAKLKTTPPRNKKEDHSVSVFNFQWWKLWNDHGRYFLITQDILSYLVIETCLGEETDLVVTCSSLGFLPGSFNATKLWPCDLTSFQSVWGVMDLWSFLNHKGPGFEKTLDSLSALIGW